MTSRWFGSAISTSLFQNHGLPAWSLGMTAMVPGATPEVFGSFGSSRNTRPQRVDGGRKKRDWRSKSVKKAGSDGRWESSRWFKVIFDYILHVLYIYNYICYVILYCIFLIISIERVWSWIDVNTLEILRHNKHHPLLPGITMIMLCSRSGRNTPYNIQHMRLCLSCPDNHIESHTAR
jgi:hypothetical protein